MILHHARARTGRVMLLAAEGRWYPGTTGGSRFGAAVPRPGRPRRL